METAEGAVTVESPSSLDSELGFCQYESEQICETFLRPVSQNVVRLCVCVCVGRWK